MANVWLAAKSLEDVPSACFHVVELTLHQANILELALHVGALVGQNFQQPLQLPPVAVGHGIVHLDDFANLGEREAQSLAAQRFGFRRTRSFS